jgi:hypothetical protein
MVKHIGFPVDKLVPVQGCIRAAILEDPLAGVEQDMYWGIDVEFAPLRYRGERIRPTMNCDLMILNIMDWRELTGAEISGDYDQLEASFQVWEHDLARSTKIRFLERDEATFRIRYDMVVEFSGMDEEDEEPELSLSAELTVPYVGFSIDSSLVEGRPGNEDRAREIAENYVDLGCYREPRIEDGVFHFDPAP